MADTSPTTTERTDPQQDAPTHRDLARATRMMVIGAVVTILAPLFGFLGGTMAGSDSTTDQYDPLVLWLMGGLGVGGIGAIVGIVGVMRWIRIDQHQQ